LRCASVVVRSGTRATSGSSSRPPLSFSGAERERRTAALQEILRELELDVLVLAGADYRGHKGILRWVADYNLVHRYGFAVVAPDREPELVLPQNLAMGRRGGWDLPIRFERDLRTGLPAALRELGTMRRIGIVGLRQVMKVEDYLGLRTAFPDAELVDAQDAFERARARKSPEEIEGARESTRIAEECFDRLLEIVEAGITEREVGAAMYERCYALGGEDPLFLSMYPERAGNGRVEGRFGPPDDRVLREGDVLVFSFELVGRLGYWMELARMVAFGEPDELTTRMNAAVSAGLDAGALAMRPGMRPDEVQRAILDAVASHGARSSYWSGHGIGQDVIEEPWLGLDVVQDRDVPSEWELEEGMVLSNHPYAVDLDGLAAGYMANTYVVRAGGGEALSDRPLDLYVVR
jgi:Xaa-Pro aminopeptidase